jgi:tRNA dimethylallyltransferase
MSRDVNTNLTDTWSRPPLLDAWYLTGPTASGKTKVGVTLAERINAEIISLDSMAIYRGMDIGTAKPSESERRLVPHHMIDVVDPTEEFSLSQFIIQAHEIAAEIRQRGRQVLFVGGTPLYLKTLLRGTFLGPAADWEFRAAVEEDVAQHGIEKLQERLRQVDPLSAHKILSGDLRRMTRALEVAKITGIPLSHWQTQFERSTPVDQCRVFALSWERAALHQRVNTRVETMFQTGLVQETQSLLAKYGNLGRTASQAVGYKEVISHLDGQQDLLATIELVKAHTRQFVRRQEIWFRSLAEITRVPLDESTSLTSVIDAIVAHPAPFGTSD